MTTYEEWRVTGTWGTGPYAFTWGRGYSDPGAEARNFVRAAQEPGPWTDGPHLHKRTVTVTEWTEVDALVGSFDDPRRAGAARRGAHGGLPVSTNPLSGPQSRTRGGPYAVHARTPIGRHAPNGNAYPRHHGEGGHE